MSKLLLVPTPIGNLGDITMRALEVLKSADLILAEDTRTTRFLLDHYGISAPLRSHHKFNEHRSLEAVCDGIERGTVTALVSDAGTPGVSDPGFLLVRRCIEREIPVEALPGATAFVPALVSSGLPSERFCFEGFLPQKKGRQKRLSQLADEERTMIFYESPFRVIKTLEQLGAALGGERRASVSRELTKKFEETIRGTLSSLAEHFRNKAPRGEFVIVVAGSSLKEHSEENA
ncbi:MAG: 16S rRNA (cytidine(1402)-2'-O)-methyltransferase [Bacteroidales bacterium]|jgi:16S rRNA (cytidine1402-2'-O)-methyltransferase|nr:16S rRNA (cytidine(1402)-2'-O)-methyltransferase [Bacteroidales bacterium]